MTVEKYPWDQPVPAYSGSAADVVRARWNSIAKPLGSLGLLEEAVVAIAGLTGDASYDIGKRILYVLCADNGVVRRGVSQTGAEVTAVLARFLARGDISVCKMAEVANTDVVGIDMGINVDLRLAGLLDKRVAAGTADLSVGPAMSREQAVQAIATGVDLVRDCKEKGYRIVVTGEVGIGNTTTSSAMASVLLGRDPADVTGKGAGLSSEGVRKKTEIVRQAIAINRPNPDDALDVLSKLGGFDIAGMTGIFLGGAIHRVPVLVDGLISSIAALTAARLCPASRTAMLATHVSAEPAGRIVLDTLGFKPLICADMCLGEGTGAIAALPLLDMAYAVYRKMLTYEEISIGEYQPRS